uniref:Uncharacterized protein n=1 Tax=Anopheles minimus TaxID=112268 RepID=A0A182WMB8_9DIPT
SNFTSTEHQTTENPSGATSSDPTLVLFEDKVKPRHISTAPETHETEAPETTTLHPTEEPSHTTETGEPEVTTAHETETPESTSLYPTEEPPHTTETGEPEVTTAHETEAPESASLHPTEETSHTTETGGP